MVTAIAFAGKAVAIPAISFLVGKAFSYLDKYHKSEGMEELKNRLREAEPKIQAVFDVVNPDHVREQSPALDEWLWQLRAAVEEAENVVDELEYYELEEKAEERKVSDWGSSLAKMKYKAVRSVKNVKMVDKTLKNFAHRDTLKRLKKAVEGLDRAAAGMVSFLAIADHLKGSASTSQQLVNNDRETSSELSASKFVGREKEKEKIIGWITNTSVKPDEAVTSTNSLPIISVVGHGGMGKTTLAQSICKEDAVKRHFKVIWVTVSTSFSATSVTSKILESVTRKKPTSNHLEPLQQLLKEELKSMKFLLVLDDVWYDEEGDQWRNLFAPLREMNTGSKILLTTRMQSVANMATSVMGLGVERDQCLTLEELEKDENIELFLHHVSSWLDPQEYKLFKSVGEKIGSKLGGCPLVTMVAIGHLRGNKDIKYWDMFLFEALKHFSGTEEGIMRVLRLSYYSLPIELQTCFRYCCIFPQDYEFEKEELIQMWMGSGLIGPHASGSKTFEDSGEQILDKLTKKSFFDLKSRVDTLEGAKQEYYVMHDLMHDLARNVSCGECARITLPAMFENHNHTVRHMRIENIHSFSFDDVRKISNFKYLRSLWIASDEGVENDAVCEKDAVCELQRVVESLKFLRLLGSTLQTFRLTGKCGKLKHLRFLSLPEISPEGLCGVIRLYHLMLFYCDDVCQNETKQVLQVRYLGYLDRLRYVSYGSSENSHFQRGLGEFSVGRLTHLQKLYNYQVEESIGNRLSAFKSLRTLRALQISGLEKVKNPEEARDANLNGIISLNSLSLNWSVSDSWSGEANKDDELVLDHLEPHCNVRELEISGYTGVKLPFWIENDLSIEKLVSLELRSCLSWDRLPSLGKLVWLKRLKLEGLKKLQQIGHLSSNTPTEFSLPPRLETLDVHDCPVLSKLPVLPPSLEFLTINHVGLTKLPMIDSETSETNQSQLVKIDVQDCKSLTSLEGSLLEQKMYMGALQYLNIKHCRNLESGSIAFEGMDRLIELNIRGCRKISTVKGELTYLIWIGLDGCPDLVSLPSTEVFMSFKSLRHMEIVGCENLMSLGGLGSLPSLACLIIKSCIKLVEVGSSLTPHGEEDHLVLIYKLEIDLPDLLLVEPLKRLNRTTELKITDGREMESLPERWLIQNGQFLQCLTIYQAMSLKSLPLRMEKISLKKFRITFCNQELLNRLRENSSSESNKISHIDRVEIAKYYSYGVGSWCSINGKECDGKTYKNPRDRAFFHSNPSVTNH